jgi:hypothetical protein
MSDPADFKYDVRVRERMLKRGLLVESDLQKHLEGLGDAEGKSEQVQWHQPALGTSDGRHGGSDARPVIGDDEREAS